MLQADIKGITLKFETNEEVFSPSGIDLGTLAMLSQVEFTKEDKVLDLGCGYGVVGILASKLIGCENVVMCDISTKAVETSKQNGLLNELHGLNVIVSDGLDSIEDTGFTKILSNPPYHVDFSVPKNFIEKGYRKLAMGGTMYMVTKRLDWYKNKLTSVFGGVRVLEINGYYVFIAQKRERMPKKTKMKNHMSKKLARKMASKKKAKDRQ